MDSLIVFWFIWFMFIWFILASISFLILSITFACSVDPSIRRMSWPWAIFFAVSLNPGIATKMGISTFTYDVL
jgi:hypothetical protein